MAASCAFCAIVGGAAPASIVYHDEHCLAFMDIRPVNPGHLLVVPRVHAAYLAELEPVRAAHLLRVARPLVAALRAAAGRPAAGVRCEGVNLFLADGEAAGQEVFHVHLHVIPPLSR